MRDAARCVRAMRTARFSYRQGSSSVDAAWLRLMPGKIMRAMLRKEMRAA